MTFIKEGQPYYSAPLQPNTELSIGAKNTIKRAIDDYGQLLSYYDISSNEVGHGHGLGLSDEAGLYLTRSIIAAFACNYPFIQNDKQLHPKLVAWGERITDEAVEHLTQTDLSHLDPNQQNTQIRLLNNIANMLYFGYIESHEENPALKTARLVSNREEAEKLAGIYRSNIYLQRIFPDRRDDGTEPDTRFFNLRPNRNPVNLSPTDNSPQDNTVENNPPRSIQRQLSLLDAFMREHPHLTSAMTGLLLLASMFGINPTTTAIDQSITQQSIAGIAMPTDNKIIRLTPIITTPQPEKSPDILGWKKFQQLMKEYGYVVRPTTPTEPRSALAGTEGNHIRLIPLADNSRILFELGIPGYIDSTEAGKEIRWEGEIDVEIPTKPGEKRIIDRYGIIPGNPNMYVRIARFYDDGAWEPYVEFKTQSPKNQK